MTTRTVAFAAVTIAALSPAVCGATPLKSSAQACARAFASSIGVADSGAQAYKLAYRPNISGSVTDVYAREFTFTLEARHVKSGATYARAVCSTDANGTVTSISVLPLDGKPTGLATEF